MIKNIKPSMVFALSVIFCTGIALSIRFHNIASFPLFWLIGMLILRPMYQSNVYWMEASILFVVWFVVRGEAGPREMYAYLPLISAVLMLGAHATGMRFIRLSVIPLIAVWFIWVSAPAPDEAFFIDPGAMKYLSPCAMQHVAPCVMNYKTWFILACTAFGMLVFGYDAMRRYPSIIGKSDMILCSHSGNTAHFAHEFMRGMNEAGMEVKLHRFHHYKDFNPMLNGDNIVIAFPVSGWKPPWPFVSYLIWRLPRGKGKPAFIIYSSYGGPENAGIVAWVILTLKGYRVAGRHWAIYPMNVATFRLGTKRMWRFIDALTPSEKALSETPRIGKEFASGRLTGLPFIMWPFLLFIVGFIADNRWLNIAAYRNYAWRRRCKKCGLCIRACPSERLAPDKKGYPKPKGTCALCFLCVNICPTNAMQLLLWSEYGHQYHPRWPQFVVKKKETD